MYDGTDAPGVSADAVAGSPDVIGTYNDVKEGHKSKIAFGAR